MIIVDQTVYFKEFMASPAMKDVKVYITREGKKFFASLEDDFYYMTDLGCFEGKYESKIKGSGDTKEAAMQSLRENISGETYHLHSEDVKKGLIFKSVKPGPVRTFPYFNTCDLINLV